VVHIAWYNAGMIPSFVRPFLWSYDIDQLDIMRDKRRIITNILNIGSVSATEWLLQTYSHDDLKSAVMNPLPGEWSKKSLNYWGIILDVKPNLTKIRTVQ
jgi:hypothetical protein